MLSSLAMTPDQFIAKWKVAELKERSAAQSHFNDLCRMLDEPSPTDADPRGEWYAFERGATKSTGGEGWADVWKRGHFGWEYKGKRKDLNQAFAQLQQYALALENPPLLVVCDLDRFRIRTNWTNSVSETHEIALDDLRDPAIRQKLKWVLSDPDKLRPGKTRQALTEQAASEFAALAKRLRDRGHPAETVAHFINRLIFCMFAEDVELLPNKLFAKMLTGAVNRPEQFQARASELFRAMERGGEAAWEPVAWFNGGLFNDDTALALEKEDIQITLRAASLDWAEIDPSILGTLFERGLDPDKRSQLGAHYTDRDKIMLIIEPVIIRPWLAEWETTKGEIEKHLAAVAEAKARTPTKQSEAKKVYAAARRAEESAHRAARAAFTTFIEKLQAFRVLDPACGSGNFLYLALLALKDIEHRAGIEAEALGLGRAAPTVGPASVKGIEINSYAAELARVSVWIGEIQWMRRNGFGVSRDPILKPLDTIECRDALLNPDGTEAIWPDADVVIGNPPFLGSKFHRKGRPATKTRPALKGLGDEYVNTLYKTYKGKVPASADLVSYWFAKVNSISLRILSGVGFIATKSIGKGASNQPISSLVKQTEFRIFTASRNEPWVVDGAEVRVAIICLNRSPRQFQLDGMPSGPINSDLTSGLDISGAMPLAENRGVAFQGVKLNGPFEIPGSLARSMLLEPANPNGKNNSSVVKRFLGNDDVTMRDFDGWIIDFIEYPEFNEAALFEKPFRWLEIEVSKHRQTRAIGEATEVERLEQFWLMQRPRPKLRCAASALSRIIGVPETSEHLIFRFLNKESIISGSLFAICREDDVAFGILSSKFHESWARVNGNQLGVGNQSRYNATRTFLTFPFPEGLTPNNRAEVYASDPRAQAIAAAASRMNELRENWLNPFDLVRREPEVVPGYPDRILPVDDRAAAILKKRTLTNLYNERPAWLVNAHRTLDDAVAAAYGWPSDISEDDALANLFALNQERAKSQGPH
jgi:type II restriction/modification system DNA methylase subunit YeeA